MDSTNHNNDLENTGNLEKPDEELNVPLLVNVTEATQDDNNEINLDVSCNRNGEADEVNSGILKFIFNSEYEYISLQD